MSDRCPECRRYLAEDENGLYCDWCGWEEPYYADSDYTEDDRSDDYYDDDDYDDSPF